MIRDLKVTALLCAVAIVAGAGLGVALSRATAPGGTITYEATGSFGEQVAYGPAPAALGGTVPMRVTTPLGHARAYQVQVQINFGGTATCKILVGGQLVSEETTTGPGSIAVCQVSRNRLTGRWGAS
jgi:hypothetical protein